MRKEVRNLRKDLRVHFVKSAKKSTYNVAIFKGERVVLWTKDGIPWVVMRLEDWLWANPDAKVVNWEWMFQEAGVNVPWEIIWKDK